MDSKKKQSIPLAIALIILAAAVIIAQDYISSDSGSVYGSAEVMQSPLQDSLAEGVAEGATEGGTGSETEINYEEEDWENFNWEENGDDVDQSKIPPEGIQHIPPEYIDVNEVSDQGSITTEQWEHGNNLQNCNNLNDPSNDAAREAFNNRYDVELDSAAGTGATVTFDGQHLVNGDHTLDISMDELDGSIVTANADGSFDIRPQQGWGDVTEYEIGNPTLNYGRGTFEFDDNYPNNGVTINPDGSFALDQGVGYTYESGLGVTNTGANPTTFTTGTAPANIHGDENHVYIDNDGVHYYNLDNPGDEVVFNCNNCGEDGVAVYEGTNIATMERIMPGNDGLTIGSEGTPVASTDTETAPDGPGEEDAPVQQPAAEEEMEAAFSDLNSGGCISCIEENNCRYANVNERILCIRNHCNSPCGGSTD